MPVAQNEGFVESLAFELQSERTADNAVSALGVNHVCSVDLFERAVCVLKCRGHAGGILAEGFHFHRPLDRAAMRFKGFSQDAIGHGLRQKKYEVVAAGEFRKICVDKEPAPAVNISAVGAMTDTNELICQTTQFQFLERACLDGDGARGFRRAFHFIDDSDRDAETAQFERGCQAGGTAPGNQNGRIGIVGHGCPASR
ncbi:MAG: hypothetical protein ABSF75_08515 [Terracidiphilus sp.]